MTSVSVYVVDSRRLRAVVFLSICTTLILLTLQSMAGEQAPGKPGTQQGATLGERLRQIDGGYRVQLEDLLREAKIADDKDAIADISSRLSAIAKYASAAPPKKLRSFTLQGTILKEGELLVSPDGIQWKNVWWGVVEDMTLNGVTWEPKWSGDRRGIENETEVLTMDIGEIVDCKSDGKVTLKRIPRGAGKTGFRVENREHPHKTTFRIKITYRPSRAAEPGAK
ncbi:MAG: hypothetical protein FJ290_02335 [Planctomycetes bacterium]|nr:hypothetical protein [Planctomycetota bacterium]